MFLVLYLVPVSAYNSIFISISILIFSYLSIFPLCFCLLLHITTQHDTRIFDFENVGSREIVCVLVLVERGTGQSIYLFCCFS